MSPKIKMKPSSRIRCSVLVAMLESYALGEGKRKITPARIKVAQELLKLDEARKKRVADGKTRRNTSLTRDAMRDKRDTPRDFDALWKELE